MISVVSVETMRQSDAATIASGISSPELMRRAGEAVFRSYAWQSGVCIVCGTGNNAGDGYVLASLLHAVGIACRLLLTEECFSPDGRYYFDRCRAEKIPYSLCTDGVDFSKDSVLVDCIFGTGFHGSAEGQVAELIEAMNASGLPILSVDINSGMNGDSGMGAPCIRSTLTVSIGMYKSGHFLGQAKDVIGRLQNADIGISPVPHAEVYYLIEQSDLRTLIPPRKQLSHKGDYGYVGILGGCSAYTGAVKLANMSCAALRCGCGVASLLLPQSLASAVAPYLLESTLTLLPDRDGFMRYDAEALDRATARLRAISVGMGWGRGEDNQKILAHLLGQYQGTLVIDADGLNSLSEMDPSLLKKAACQVVLTPHQKEFERLSGYSAEQIRTSPIRCAQDYAKENCVILLLKGPTTVITNGNETFLVDRGCAGMATAGSGDVLSGVLAGLLGYLPPAPLTIAAGAYLAGVAGELAAAEMGEISALASDTVRCLPQAVRMLFAI